MYDRAALGGGNGAAEGEVCNCSKWLIRWVTEGDRKGRTVPSTAEKSGLSKGLIVTNGSARVEDVV